MSFFRKPNTGTFQKVADAHEFIITTAGHSTRFPFFLRKNKPAFIYSFKKYLIDPAIPRVQEVEIRLRLEKCV